MKDYYVYILASKRKGILYVGVTNNLERRIWEHKSKSIPGFTKKYNVDKLVYYEYFDDIEVAIMREKALKKLSRRNKVLLINRFNPEYKDLFGDPI